MITTPVQAPSGTRANHRTLTLFLVVLAALAVAATVIVLLATSPWSSNSTTTVSHRPVPTQTVLQCAGPNGRVVQPC